MKKSLVAALTTAIAVGTASTTFAAANPFSDLPADHWAYDAVTQLAADGVVEGYGDTTFRGDRNITRYEMAQMIAKLMAKTDWGASDRALLDKLAAEFSEELNNLGVRVANLERNADMVKWNGMLRYTYKSVRHEWGPRYAHEKTNSDTLKFRLEPTAEVNDHWHVVARLDADTDMAKDTGTGAFRDGNRVQLKRAYAQGDYRNFQVKFGKMGLYPRNQMGMIFDDEFSGAEVTFGKNVKVTLQAGRLDVGGSSNDLFNGNSNLLNPNRVEDDAANFQAINVGVDHGKLLADVGYINLKTDNLKGAEVYGLRDPRYNKGTNNKGAAHIWYIDARYQFTNPFGISVAYAQNTEADFQDDSWQALIHYKGANKDHKGSWGFYTGYRKEGLGASVAPSDDAIQVGQKGWEIGADYTFLKNVVGYVKYFRGKDMDVLGHDDTAQTLWGRVEFFF